MASVTFNGKTLVVQDLSCAVVGPVVATNSNLNGYSVTGCSADPVVQGTSIHFASFQGSSVYFAGSSGASTSIVLSSVSQTVDADPFDYVYASAIWSLAFTTIICLYLVSKNVGVILALVRGR